MKQTAGEILKARGAIESLLGMRFEPAVAFRMRKFSVAIREVLDDLEKSRQLLIRKYGTKGPQGLAVQDPEKLAQFAAEWDKVLQESVDIPDLRITIEEISNAKLVLNGPGGSAIETTFTVEEMANLEKVLTYGEGKQ